MAEALVELDAQSLERPVNAYINHKLTTMRENSPVGQGLPGGELHIETSTDWGWPRAYGHQQALR